MVTPDGAIRIMDFGIAANLKNVYSRTTGSPLSLSVHYASPEQINGAIPDPAMDIYSIGCVFYEMLAGHPPFVQGDVLHQQLTREPSPIPGAPADLNRLILACLQKDVRKRTQSATDIRAALSGLKTVRMKGVRTPGAAPHRAAGSGSKWIAGIALAGAILLAGGGVVWWQMSHRLGRVPLPPITQPLPAPVTMAPVIAPLNEPPPPPAGTPAKPRRSEGSVQKELKDAATRAEEARLKAVQDALDQCERLRNAGDYPRAIAILNNALDRSPGDARLQDALTGVRMAETAEERLKFRKNSEGSSAPAKQ